ncbi:MAG TPA: ergothioneine biosynthesis protein EgtC [Actinomycetota bacterium]|nr:ergothioneine biosynthesis protein EgtC [Actinomycetota bacterium]
MCRFLAYLGPSRTLDTLLIEPQHSLYRQSWEPQNQKHGTINADGFGVGWYEPSLRPEPALYRSARPIWADRSFASMAGVLASGAVLAAVRSATEPAILEESNVPPFVSGRYLFAHNGAIEGFRDGVASKLRRGLSEERDSGILGTTDSEVLFALTLDELDGGASLADALAAVVARVSAVARCRLNMIVTDGGRIAATSFGDDLFVGDEGDSVFVCSEPFDDSSTWKQIDDRMVLEAGIGEVSVSPLSRGDS